jgi:hypothetical protein
MIQLKTLWVNRGEAVDGPLEKPVDLSRKLSGRVSRRRIAATPEFAQVIQRDPDPPLINALFTGRQELTVRGRRFMWLTNAFSKRFENLCHPLGL